MKLGKSLAPLFALLFCLGFSQNAQANVPHTMTYTGQLNAPNGAPVVGVVNSTFRIYDAPTGGNGVWAENYSGINVQNGEFRVQMGTMMPLEPVFNGEPYWLEITIQGETLSPRTPLETVPYAFRANDANTVGGHTAADLINAAGGGTAATTSYDNTTSGLNATDVQAALDDLAARVAALEALTQDMERTTINNKTAVTFTGVNFHVRNGTGTTDGPVNGLGNLVVGYDEAWPSGNTKTGSHNIIVGIRHDYTSFGGFVAGHSNAITGEYASITGGADNTASGNQSSISGGAGNTSSAYSAWVGGGAVNTASAQSSAVCGGISNTASGLYSSVSGGRENQSTEMHASVSGGWKNVASGESSSVSGGRLNTASGFYSSVSGGYKNEAQYSSASVCGGSNNIASGSNATVSGGVQNTADGNSSSVSGGYNRTVSSWADWQAGGLFQNQ
ncbi:hypothetical protein [Bradymonas sediminis]|uniref:Uncharacterized protein n=1 Tax=Bradymonas sediminis TaxID=1548548 RepID=A0A2Z4FH49_9DELT|nr:hypothetical protein [Bradymonas sediminis]AWV88297.1 hypothetical protein DN745_02650 [Bradymonas sediminis]TDP77420.1 hypothetical protein DFR33_101322 [Bradymonas sediminis]